MAKLKSEDLRLNIIVNGDAGRKEILDTQKSITALEASLKSLKKAEGDNSAAIAETSKKLSDAKAKFSDLQKQVSLENKTLSELKSHIRVTRAALEKAVPGTENWQNLNRELLVSRRRYNELERQARDTSKSLRENLKDFGMITVGFKAIADAVSSLWERTAEMRQAWLDYDEALVDAMKTTGLTREEMEDLSEQLKKIDTRTAQNELLALARVGGKLGISGKEDLLEFVSAADKINVALKEDLGGDAEAAIGQIGKLVDIFQLKGQMGLERAMLSVGSAINELGAASTANEGYIVNFTNRLAGIAPNADISIDKILGLAATLDANAQAAETSATAIGQVIIAMFKKTETFAEIAKTPLEEFRNLLEMDVNAALVKVLEGMKGENGLFDITHAMDEMHLNGQRAVTVLGSLANNIEMLKSQQALANEAFTEGVSLTNEFNTKNQSATAIQEKLTKSITETSVEIGQKLMPAANVALRGTSTFLGVISQLISMLTKYRATVVAVGVALAAYTLKKKLAYLGSIEFRQSLLKEVALLEASGKANTVHAVSLKILAGGYASAGAAAKAFGAALLANPIGLITAGVAALATGIAAIVSSSREATKGLGELNKRTVDTTSALISAQIEMDKERKRLENLKRAALDAAEGSDERKAAIDKINDAYGEYLPALLAEKTTNEDIEASLRRVNAQLENKIRLQAKENAEMDVANHKTETVKATVKALAEAYKKRTGQEMSASDVEVLAQSTSSAYDSGNLSEWGLTVNSAFGGKSSRAILKITQEFHRAAESGKTLRSTIDGLFGDLESNPQSTGTLGALVGSAATTEASSVSSSQSASPVGNKNDNAAKDLGRRIKEQAELKTQLIIDNEQDLTQKALLEEDRRYSEELAKSEGNAELIELVEIKHRNKVEDIRLAAFDRELKDLQSKHALEKKEMQNAQAAELLTFQVTADEKEALKRKQNEELAQFDLQYLSELQVMLESLVDTRSLEGMPISLDNSELQKLKTQLADVLAQMNALQGGDAASGSASGTTATASSGKKEGRSSIKQGTGKGEMFGVSQDSWETLFENLAQGQFGAEELQTTISGIGGAAQEAFDLAAKFSDLATAKEEEQLKKYKKSQDKKKNTLEKRLNAGLITESQYNAQVEQMDAEYDAYQEELAIKQAKREKALNLTQAIINTALSITSTIAQWGLPWGLIPAAVAAAMGAAEIAIIASQPITTGAEEGGFVNVRREQDGKGFNAKLSPDARGFVSGPTVIVGENGAEYVVPHEALENPTLAPVLATLETARRNGKLRSLNFCSIYPAMAMQGRAQGGFVSVATTSGGATATIGGGSDAVLAKVLEKLARKLDEPITASVSMLGRGGIKETEEKYNRIKRRGQLG